LGAGLTFAGDTLERVQVPTLLIVGGLDDVVMELNREAYRMMRGIKELKVVPGATHLLKSPAPLRK